MIVKVSGVPVQPLALGVTSIVAVSAVVPVLEAVKLAMFPVPDAARPIDVLSFVQLYVVPATSPVKVTAVVEALLHKVSSDGSSTVGVGFTVIVKVSDVPVQEFALGVTSIVAVSDVVPAFVAVKLAISPVPLAAKPIEVLSFVQLYVVPVTVPLNVTAVVDALLHKVSSDGSSTVGVGFTVIVKVSGVPAQPFALGVTSIVAVSAIVPVFVAVKLAIFPVLDAARPIEALSFVQL